MKGAQSILERLERVDPLTGINGGAKGWLAWFEGDFGAAMTAWADWWRTMEDQKSATILVLAYFRAASGDVPGAIAIVNRMQADTPSHLLTTLGVFLKYAWLGQKPEALAAVTGELEEAALWDDVWPLFLAAGYSLIGELDAGFHWLDQAVGHGIMNVRYLNERDPFLANLRDDPRFAGVLEKAASSSAAVAAAAAAATVA
jgi:hypothetical protein